MGTRAQVIVHHHGSFSNSFKRGIPEFLSKWRKLVIRLPRQYFRDSMPNGDACFLSLLLRETGGDAYFQRWLDLVVKVSGIASGSEGH